MRPSASLVNALILIGFLCQFFGPVPAHAAGNSVRPTVRLHGFRGASPKKADTTMRSKVKSEIIAWFWIGLVFLLVNGTLGQARVIPSG